MDRFCASILNVATTQLIQQAGFKKTSRLGINVLSDVFGNYLELLAKTASNNAMHAGRSQINEFDVKTTFDTLNINIKELEEWVVNEKSGKNRGWCGADPSPLLKDLLATGISNDSADKQVLEFKNFVETMDTSEKEDSYEYKVEEESSKEMKLMASSSHVKESSRPSYIPDFLPPLPDVHEKFQDTFNSFMQNESPSVKPQQNESPSVKPQQTETSSVKPQLSKKTRKMEELSYCHVTTEETLCASSSYGLFDDYTENSMPELSDSELSLFVLKPITSQYTVAADPTDEISHRMIRKDRKIGISYNNLSCRPDLIMPRQISSRTSRRAVPKLFISYQPSATRIESQSLSPDESPSNRSSRVRKRSRKLEESEEFTTPNVKKAKTEKSENNLVVSKKKAVITKTAKPSKNTSTSSDLCKKSSSTRTAKATAKQQLPSSTPDNKTESSNSEEVINCICEFPDKDNGKFMVSCDNCSVWFHGECVELGDELTKVDTTTSPSQDNSSININYSSTISSISSIITDQLPNNPLTNLDQFLARRTSSASSLFSTGSQSTLDINAQELVLKEKSKKACTDIELYTRHLLNDSSLGLYHMSEHIRKKVPQFVEEKKNLITLSNKLDLATANITDSREIIKNISNLEQFTNITNLLKRTLEIIEKK
ncbi:9134_t:CDS:2 [Ambispora gerdemannii]|uniref:9134_t:CDS:1 n=1 Tax=Ambispora gerdemannii TaxID=144530 RepID=A0A9N8V3L3_9GLOM|nr:9134_t:CDS:2 [Ambispora gerdemannii]